MTIEQAHVKPSTDTRLWVSRYPETPRELEIVKELQEKIFEKAQYIPIGQLYKPYEDAGTAHFLGMFPANGEDDWPLVDDPEDCIGGAEMIDGDPDLLTPMFHGMVIDVDRKKWVGLTSAGLMDEYAVVGVKESWRRSHKVVDLIRAGYRHSRPEAASRQKQPVEYTGTILVPSWAERLNAYGFNLVPVGPPQHYMENTEYREEEETQPYVIHWRTFEETADPVFVRWMQHGPRTQTWDAALLEAQLAKKSTVNVSTSGQNGKRIPSAETPTGTPTTEAPTADVVIANVSDSAARTADVPAIERPTIDVRAVDPLTTEAPTADVVIAEGPDADTPLIGEMPTTDADVSAADAQAADAAIADESTADVAKAPRARVTHQRSKVRGAPLSLPDNRTPVAANTESGKPFGQPHQTNQHDTGTPSLLGRYGADKPDGEAALDQTSLTIDLTVDDQEHVGHSGMEL